MEENEAVETGQLRPATISHQDYMDYAHHEQEKQRQQGADNECRSPSSGSSTSTQSDDDEEDHGSSREPPAASDASDLYRRRGLGRDIYDAQTSEEFSHFFESPQTSQPRLMSSMDSADTDAMGNFFDSDDEDEYDSVNRRIPGGHLYPRRRTYDKDDDSTSEGEESIMQLENPYEALVDSSPSTVREALQEVMFPDDQKMEHQPKEEKEKYERVFSRLLVQIIMEVGITSRIDYVTCVKQDPRKLRYLLNYIVQYQEPSDDKGPLPPPVGLNNDIQLIRDNTPVHPLPDPGVSVKENEPPFDESWLGANQRENLLVDRNVHSDEEEEQRLLNSYNVASALMQIPGNHQFWTDLSALIFRLCFMVFHIESRGSFHHACGVIQKVIQIHPHKLADAFKGRSHILIPRMLMFMHHSPVPDSLVQLISVSHTSTAAGGIGRGANFGFNPMAAAFNPPNAAKVGPHLFSSKGAVPPEESCRDLWNSLSQWDFLRVLGEHIWHEKYASIPGHSEESTQAFLELVRSLREAEGAKCLFKCFHRNHSTPAIAKQCKLLQEPDTAIVEGLIKSACTYVPMPHLHSISADLSEGNFENASDIPSNVDCGTPCMKMLCELAELTFEESIPEPDDQPPMAMNSAMRPSQNKKNYLRIAAANDIASTLIAGIPTFARALVTLHKRLHPKVSISQKSSRKKKKHTESTRDTNSHTEPLKQPEASPHPHPDLSVDESVSVRHPGEYVAPVPFGAYRLSAVKLLQALLEFSPKETMDAMSTVPELWGCLVAWYFEYPHSNIYHQIFYQMVLTALQFGYSESADSNEVGHVPTLRILLTSYKLITRLIQSHDNKTLSSRGATLRILNAIRLASSAANENSFLAAHLRDHAHWNDFEPQLRQHTRLLVEPLVAPPDKSNNLNGMMGIRGQFEQLGLQMQRTQAPVKREFSEKDLELGSDFAKELGFEGWSPYVKAVPVPGSDDDGNSSVDSGNPGTSEDESGSSSKNKKKKKKRKKGRCAGNETSVNSVVNDASPPRRHEATAPPGPPTTGSSAYTTGAMKSPPSDSASDNIDLDEMD